MTLAEVERMALPVPVLHGPHWRVNIRPGTYRPNALPSLEACWDLMAATSVAWRAWDFPHVNEKHQDEGPSWVASWSDWRMHLEYWRMYQSGQFLYFGAFHEDRITSTPAAVLGTGSGAPTGFQPSGFLDVQDTLYRLTEVFEFGSRLAIRGLLDDGGLVRTSFLSVKDRFLTSTDPGYPWDGFAAADKPEFSYDFPATHLIVPARAHAAALEAAIAIFESFGWSDYSRDSLAQLQHEFIDGARPFSRWRKAYPHLTPRPPAPEPAPRSASTRR